MRFLPVRLGTKGTWFARVAKHWLDKKPIVCPADTGEGFGGNKEAPCACCDVSRELNNSPDEKVSRFGWETRAGSQWITYCIVLEKDGQQLSGNELLMPYEFAHYVSSWEQLKRIWLTGCKGGKNPNSVLDYRTGNDFVVSGAAKGMILDKQDSGPLFDVNDATLESYIEKIEANLHFGKIRIPSTQELQDFADRIRQQGERMAHSPSPDHFSSRLTRGGQKIEPGQAGVAGGNTGLGRPSQRPAATSVRQSAPVEDDMTPPADDESNPELNPVPLPEDQPLPKSGSKSQAPAVGPEPGEEAETLPLPVPRRGGSASAGTRGRVTAA